MADVLIVKNCSREGPGLLSEVLADKQITFEVVDLQAGKTLPGLSAYKAVVVLGGPDSANDQTSKMLAEVEWVQAILEKNLPFLGVCLGMQVLVKAAGGTVLRAPRKEVGFYDFEGNQNKIELTQQGKSDPLLVGLPASLDIFHLHGETVDLPADAELLGTGPVCRNQIVRIGKCAYGIQSHFELTPAMLAVWSKEDPDLQPLGADALQGDFKTIRASYIRIGEQLFTNFLHIAGLI